MARKKSKDATVDNELVYSFAKTGKLNELEDFVQTTTTAKLVECGDRCFNENLYHAAKIIYSHISNYAKLAKALVKLELWTEAVDAAKKAKAIETWKFVCFACCQAKEFKLAQVCALHVIGIMEHLQELVQFYENLGFYDQLIQLLEAGINLERTHQGIFTALGVLYAKHQEDKLFEHLKLFASRSNIPQLIVACRENYLWPECVFLQTQYEQYDNAIEIMISEQSASTAWKHDLCKELLLKCSNAEVIYRCIDFYYYYYPLLLTDILLDTEKQIDPTRVIYKLKQFAQNSNNNINNTTNYALIIKYLLHVQHQDVSIVNETLHEVFIEEENYTALRTSIEEHKQFDQIGLAQKLEKHSVLEFRRIAAVLYKQNGRYEKSIALSKSDQLYHDMMETCATAKQQDLTVELLHFFVENGLHECFAAMLYTCYSVIPSDIVLELSWRHGLTNFVMPYMIQTFSTLNAKLGSMEQKVNTLEQQQKVTDKVQKEQIDEKPQQDAIGLGLVPGAAGAVAQPLMIGYIPQQPLPQQQGW